MAQEKQILIIDDDPDAVAYLKEVLEGEGYTTATASNGEEGLKEAQENPPDLILLDLMMPKKSGTKFLTEIRSDQRLKKIPIVVESGARQATGVDMKQYLEEQPFRKEKKKVFGPEVDTRPDAYLEKPIDAAELLRTVKKLLSERESS